MLKTVTKSFWLIPALLVFFFLVPFANAQEPAAPEATDEIEETQYIGGEEGGALPDKAPSQVEKNPADIPTTIKADKITNDGKSGVSNAYGKVFIQKGSQSLWGNTATYNKETGDTTIEGDVHYIDEGEGVEMFCEKADMNFGTNVGTLYNARVNVNNEYYMSGEKIIQKGKDKFLIENGGVTTCAQEEPHWKLDAAEVDLTLEGYAYMKHLVFRAGGVPIFYSPYWIASTNTKRATGFLAPSIGSSNKNGTQVENAFFWAIAENADLTLTHKHMGKKGNIYGSELRYILGEGTRGNLHAELLQETDPDKEADRELWKVKYDHNQALPTKINGVVHLDLESEDSIDREYGDNVVNRTRRYTDSYVTLDRKWTNRALTVVARQQDSTLPDREDKVTKLPSIIFTNQQEQLLDSPFYAALESSYTSFRTEAVRDEKKFPFDVDRFDFHPSLSMPIAVAPWLSLTPELGYRYTTYTDGVNNEEGGLLGESFARQYYTASLGLKGPRFYKIFDSDSKTRPKAKHLITPSIQWDFLPDYSFDGENRQKVSPIDGIDTEVPTNVVKFSLLNQVFVKDMAADETSKTNEIVFFNIVQSYDINEADRDENPEIEKKPLGSLLFDLDTHVVPWLLLNYRTTYSHYDNRFDTSLLELGFAYENIFHLSLERSYKWGGDAEGAENSVWDTLYLDANFGNRVSMDYSLIYDEFNGELTNNVLRMHYTEDCWSVTLSWFERTINVNNGSGEEDLERETGFLFSINLLGVGDVFGKKQRPVYGRKI